MRRDFHRWMRWMRRDLSQVDEVVEEVLSQVGG